MANITNNLSQENPKYKFICKTCDYYCNNKKDFNKHLLTQKHISKQKGELPINEINFTCNCGKIYKHKSSLCKHRKTCNFKKENINCEKIDYKELVITLIKENNDIKEIMKKQQDQLMKQQDQISELIPKIGNNNNNNSNNKFNINVFFHN